ncbi:hypothetical protein B0H10DRAFT_1659624, partial [Mycena sp. CBHHK59/15]
DHPLHMSHYIRCDHKKLDTLVPNFVGGSLPQVDRGDQDFYCCTILTLFKLWRSGKSLKTAEDTWDEIFVTHTFNSKVLRLMKIFNVRYECNDARDDYYSQQK